MFIKRKTLFFTMLLCLILCSCKKEIDYSKIVVEPPEKATLSSTKDYNLNFIMMHNFVVDSLQEELTPFFYITEGEFDIDGDNEKKLIRVKCKCMDGCVQKDIDLFFSMVLNYIAINAAEQDYRFASPKTQDDGSYVDYGTVFNYYDLKLDCKTESGTVIRDDFIKKGNPIPIDPRFIKES